MAKKEINKADASQLKPFEEKEFELIRWDRPTKIFLGIFSLLFILTVLGKYHYSSIPVWYQLFGENQKIKKEVVLGKPQTIRSDEWLVDATHMLSQANRDYPVSNPSLAYGNAPLIMSMPVADYTSFFRPQMWGYFLFGKEIGFSWMWQFRVFIYLIAMTLLFKLITNNNLLLSVFGSVWLLLSSGITHWSISSHTVADLAILVILAIYLLFKNKPIFYPMYAFGIVIFGFDFLISFYPPRQIPQIYIGILVLVGYLLMNKDQVKWDKQMVIKSICLSVSLAIIGFLFFHVYSTAKSTIDTLGSTVYPGKRESFGGDWPLSRIFTEFLIFFTSDEKLPSQWANVCEAANFLLFFPVALYGAMYNFINKRRQSILMLCLLGLTLFFFLYMLIPIPGILAKVTLLSFVPGFRLTYGFGILNIVLMIVYLSDAKYAQQGNFSFQALVFVITTALVFVLCMVTNNYADNYFSMQQLVMASILWGLVSTLFIFNGNKYYLFIAMAIIFLAIVRNATFNPISKSLAPIIKNRFYLQVSNIMESDKEDSKWVVYGQQFMIANFVKSTGANVLNGVKYAPDLATMHVLDPAMKNDSVYNRYAHIVFNPYIDGKDSVIFNLVQQDLYVVNIDPCSEKLKQLDVKYFVFTYQPQPAEVRCMELISTDIFSIYKIQQ